MHRNNDYAVEEPTTKPPRCGGMCWEIIKTLVLIAQWMFFSCTIILFNKWILSNAGFNYPITLVLMHMMFVSFAAWGCKICKLVEITQISGRQYLLQVLPVGIVFAASLALSNIAYLFLSVAFIQMIKASTPVVVLIMSFVAGLEAPSFKLGFIILFISTGIAISAYGEIHMNMEGLLIQVSAVCCEGLRLTLINLLLTQRGLKLSSISSLYYIGPASFVSLLGPWLYFEAREVFAKHALQKIGAPLLLANASVAFILNLSTMALVKNTSALTLNVGGVVKDWLLILLSVFMHGAVVTGVQYGGYSIAFLGVTYYSRYKFLKAAQQASAQHPMEQKPLMEPDEEDQLEPTPEMLQGDEKFTKNV